MAFPGPARRAGVFGNGLRQGGIIGSSGPGAPSSSGAAGDTAGPSTAGKSSALGLTAPSLAAFLPPAAQFDPSRSAALSAATAEDRDGPGGAAAQAAASGGASVPASALQLMTSASSPTASAAPIFLPMLSHTSPVISFGLEGGEPTPLSAPLFPPQQQLQQLHQFQQQQLQHQQHQQQLQLQQQLQMHQQQALNSMAHLPRVSLMRTHTFEPAGMHMPSISLPVPMRTSTFEIYDNMMASNQGQ